MRIRLRAVTVRTVCLRAAPVALAVALGCGGSVGPQGHDDDAGVDATADEGSIAPQCESPGGFALCGGDAGCTDTASCKCLPRLCDSGAALCMNAAGSTWKSLSCFLCPDGQVCVQNEPLCGLDAPSALGACYPYEVGVLFAANGASTQVFYADYSLWTGDPLPTPTTCPTFGTFRICGGNCGGCNNGEVCTGRSPLHPYGTCIATSAPPCSNQGTTPCEVGSSCFRYTVQPSAQAGADANGVCLPTAECQDLAANLPGGGTCQ